MANSNQQSGGIGFLGVLLVLFIALKLTDVIQWSWWYVMAPMWGPFAFAAIIGVLYVIYQLGVKSNGK